MTVDSSEFARAVALHGEGQSGAAEALCRRLLAASPDDAQTLHLLGAIRFSAGAQEEAVELVQRAVSARPDYGAAIFNLGAMLAAAGRLSEAADRYRRAAELDATNVDAQARLAAVLMQLGRLPEAQAAFEHVLERRPDDAIALTDLAALALQAGNVRDAVQYARRAVAAAPQLAAARLRLGHAARAAGQIDEAVMAFEAANAIAPSAEAFVSLGILFGEEGRASEAAGALAAAARLQPENAALHSLVIMAQELDPRASIAERMQTRRTWAERFADPLTQEAPPLTNARDPSRRLRIGYVGADTFRNHTGSTVLLPIVEGHDRNTLDVYCYSDTPAEWDDDVTARYRQASIYRATAGLSDDHLATLIRRDGVDVLIETYGHPPGSRLLAVARRPAPVQFGFQTMGSNWMAAIDYVAGDRILAPHDAEFRERIVHLPIAYSYDPLLADPPMPADGPFERTGTIVFGSFNRWSKFNDPVLTAWARILRRLPKARLVLRSRQELVPHTARFQQRLVQAGLPLDRVSILPWSGSPRDYLADHREIDIALDPFPYGGGTTTLDALFMGVPVVARSSDRVLGRYSEDFLAAVGLRSLVVQTADQYVALAVRLAEDHAWRQALRRELAPALKASRLCDGRWLARNLERVYRAAWRTWCSASPA